VIVELILNNSPLTTKLANIVPNPIPITSNILNNYLITFFSNNEIHIDNCSNNT